MTSIPSVNFTPRISFGNWLWPWIRRQVFWAPSTSLKAMASAVLFDRQLFDRIVLSRQIVGLLGRSRPSRVSPRAPQLARSCRSAMSAYRRPSGQSGPEQTVLNNLVLEYVPRVAAQFRNLPAA